MVDPRPARERHAKSEPRRHVSDAALVAIRRENTVVVCFEATLDPRVLEAAVSAERVKAPGLRFSIERAQRKVRISVAALRDWDALEACARALGGEAPWLDMS